MDFVEGREGERFEGSKRLGGEEFITMLLHSTLASSVKERRYA